MFSSFIQRYKKNSVTDLVLKLRKLFPKVLKIKPRWLQIFRFGYFGKKRIFFHGLLKAEKKILNDMVSGAYSSSNLASIQNQPWIVSLLKENNIDRHFTFVGAT